MSINKSILIVAGEPNSIFLEIFFKTLNKIKIKNPLILIASFDLIQLQMKKLKYKKKIRLLEANKLHKYTLNNNQINLINVNYDQGKAFKNISSKSNKYINRCFKTAFDILKKKKIKKFINGPISKKTFLNKKYLGVTEFISKNFNTKKYGMLIYNKKLSVSPITTHLPLKSVPKKITQKIIIEKVKLVNNFFRNKLKINPKIAILGLNPHCESVLKFNEDEKILTPAVKKLYNLGINISGPLSADTIFLKKNREKFNIIVGMYHDQVLTPIKTLFEYDAINITMGLPFIRVSPDHGPNEKMMGKNLSNPLSLIKSIKFLDKN